MLPKVIKSETRYHGRAFSVRVDEVEIRPGQVVRLDIIEHTGAITLLPLDEQRNVWFVRQYRHAARQTLLELPAGTLNPGEQPAMAANRELQEEIGMRAERLEHLGIYHSHPAGDNVPSARDIELAYYPEAAYFIVSLLPGAGKAIRAFSIRNGSVSEMWIEAI